VLNLRRASGRGSGAGPARGERDKLVLAELGEEGACLRPTWSVPRGVADRDGPCRHVAAGGAGLSISRRNLGAHPNQIAERFWDSLGIPTHSIPGGGGGARRESLAGRLLDEYSTTEG